jgi:hypothetical protein
LILRYTRRTIQRLLRIGLGSNLIKIGIYPLAKRTPLNVLDLRKNIVIQNHFIIPLKINLLTIVSLDIVKIILFTDVK